VVGRRGSRAASKRSSATTELAGLVSFLAGLVADTEAKTTDRLEAARILRRAFERIYLSLYHAGARASFPFRSVRA
jgi:hypothetical protein